jgi:hypothetical protein
METISELPGQDVVVVLKLFWPLVGSLYAVVRAMRVVGLCIGKCIACKITVGSVLQSNLQDLKSLLSLGKWLFINHY